MLTGLSEADLQLLGYTEINRDQSNVDESMALVFHATAPAGLSKVTETFVYLKSRTTQKQASELLSKIPRQHNTYVIVPQSTKSRPEIGSLCRTLNIPCLVHEEMLWERAYSLFKDYVDSISESIVAEKYYIQPRKEGDSKSELDRELIEFLKGSRTEDKGTLLALIASAGVGKTTIARYLTITLAKEANTNHLVPIYVESQHWSKLQLDGVDELWDIILNSISQFSTSLHVTEELFRHMLQHGLLCFIFDGFDELCGHRRFPLSAADVLEQLARIAQDSDARMILTTRTLYWESEIANKPSNVRTEQLAPFNTQQAKGYFSKHFPDDIAQRDRAFSLYQNLQKRVQPPTVEGGISSRTLFINLPVCVNIVAECVKLGAINDSAYQFEQGIVRGFLDLICEREQVRQGLLATAGQQLLAFEEITIEHVDKQAPEFNLEILELIGIAPQDISKIASHPLLRRISQSKYKFAYDFLPYFFKARHLSQYLQDNPRTMQEVSVAIMSAEANGKGFVLEHLYDICKNVGYAKLREIYQQLPKTAYDARSFFFHLIKVLVAHDASLHSRRERTEILFGTLYENPRMITDLVVIGKIDNLDFSNITFQKCHFIDLVLSDCTANQNTRFEECVFRGDLEFVNCSDKDWASVKLCDTMLYPPSNLVWEKFSGIEIGSKEDHVKDAMRLGLSKFWRNGRLKSGIRRSNWTTGSLGHSIYCKSLLDAMLQTGLIAEEHISGVVGGGYIFDRQSIRELQKFMDSRQPTGKVRQVYEKLMKA